MTEALTEKQAPITYKGKPGVQAPEIVVERGLQAMAYHNGNARRASHFLRDSGIEIHDTTLMNWARGPHSERYHQIREEYAPKMRAQAADEHMDLAERAMRVNSQILDRLKEKVPELPAKELPGAARNMAVTAAVHTEKAQLLNEQPTQRVTTDLEATLKELKSLGVDPKTVLEGEVVAEEDVKEIAA